MAHKLKTKAGWKTYGLRKQTVEPVIGIIKSVMGVRHGVSPVPAARLEEVNGEWTLACLAWNLKRMAVMRHQSAPSMNIDAG